MVLFEDSEDCINEVINYLDIFAEIDSEELFINFPVAVLDFKSLVLE